MKRDPYVASGRTSEIFPPDLLKFLREIGIDAIGIECVRIVPINLSSFGIDLLPCLLSDREPLFDNPFFNLLDEGRCRRGGGWN